ncbi:MAG: hypothetical protein JZU47_16350 [Prolixibacteraceae bacterium]|nr:hypothetical protein [Prolixibacteraceae bacterium]
MKRYSFLIILTMCFILNSKAQQSDRKPNSPKEDIKVNREYDEQGNLIRFDSTYTYNWSGDTTLMNSILPKDMNGLLNDQFMLLNDSSFMGKSFFDDFDQLFFSPFNSKRDSALLKKFGMNQFHSFNFMKDSLSQDFSDFDDFFGQMNPNKSDSIAPKTHKMPYTGSPRTMDDMMKMMQRQMQEMEEMQREFFEEHQSQKNQPKLKEN